MIKNIFKRKWLAVGIILLFVGVTIVPAIAQNTEKSQSTSRDNWWYVGGSGPGNYTRIQDAIDNASDGDTIFVYNGMYTENLVVNKSLTLVGQDKNFTIIETHLYQYPSDSIQVNVDEVSVSGFTIQHNDAYPFTVGINLNSCGHVAIFDNIIRENNVGIYDSQTYDLTIVKNILYDNYNAIYCSQSNGILISENTLSDNNESIFLQYCYSCHLSNNTIYHTHHDGIDFYASTFCDVENNSITFSYSGLDFSDCYYCTVISNQISSNEDKDIELYNTGSSTIKHNILENSAEGIGLTFCVAISLFENSFYNHTSYGLVNQYSVFTTVTRNNFRNNTRHAYFEDSRIDWNGNYWGRPMIHPKLIIGERSINIFNQSFLFPEVNFDWHPALKPYDIPGVK
jgi:nitrous oxidase accessory protein